MTSDRRVVVHIGAPKTGTTAVQSSLAACRDALAGQGVVYPGRGINHVPHLRSPLRWPADAEMAALDAQRWDSLRRQVRRADGRVVVSAESIAAADDEISRQVIEGLGGDRVEAVVTLRPLVAVLPAAYQEDVKAGVATPYGSWLDAVVGAAGPPPDPSRPFWQVHDHGELVERWVRLLGADRVTVVVVDPQQPDDVFRAFDTILDVRPGTVDAARSDHGNRSLTLAECELVRRLNDALGGADDLTIRRRLVPPLAVWAMTDGRRPTADEPRLGVPDDVREALVPVARSITRRLAACGCRVIGDLVALESTDAQVPAWIEPWSADLPVDAAALFAGWMLRNGVTPRP